MRPLMKEDEGFMKTMKWGILQIMKIRATLVKVDGGYSEAC